MPDIILSDASASDSELKKNPVTTVIDGELIIAVVAVGKRERSDVYHLASLRLR